MKIALLGYGVEGQSAYHYYARKFPDARFEIYDNAPIAKYEIPDEVKFTGGLEHFHDIKADIIVRTPAITPSRVSGLGKVTSVTNDFFANCPAPIIGVTGTKGKGTTCSLIAEILKATGKKVWLVGNIGVPALDVLEKVQPGDIVVYELSSFQLWDLEISPHVAVILMIEPDHMDVHSSVVEYVWAKSHITLNQTKDDMVVYHPTNRFSAQIAEASPSINKKRYASSEAAHVDGDEIVMENKIICKKAEAGLLGDHNIENICAAITAVWHFTQNVGLISKAVKNFHGLEHRLEFVRTVKGVKFYNDSFSSAPGATVAAIKSFQQPEIVIMGGYDKHVSFDDFAGEIKSIPNIKKIVLIGQTKQQMATSFKKAGISQFETLETTNFKKIVNDVFVLAEAGDVVLLSPGCASFDMFDNFYERGNQFKEIVKNIEK